MTPLRELIPGIASGRTAIFAGLAAHATPEPDLSVSEWAERYRIVGVESQSPHPGPWRNQRAPYLVEPMDACQAENGISRVVLTGAAQFGKSECPLNALFHLIDTAPRGVMVLLPSLDETGAWSRLKWEPNVEESPRLRTRVFIRKSRSDQGSTTKVKKFRGGSIEIATAGASKGLQMRTVGYVVAEECDQYEDEVGIGGDPVSAAEARMLTFGADAKTVLCSTPGFLATSRITREFKGSDQRRWFTPCPHCDDCSVLDFGTMSFHEGRPVFSCPSCGGVLEESHKRPANARGRWIPTFAHPEESEDAATNPAPPKIIPPDALERWAQRDCEGRPRGYHLWQGQSNLSSWLTIWTRWQEVQSGSGDEVEFVQKVLGEAYEQKVERPDHEKLYEARGQLYPNEGVVPEWASMVTGAIDVQFNRLEWAVYAWGKGGVGARIAAGVIYKNPLDWETWREDADALVNTTFSGPSYLPRKADYWGVDSGGNATDNVYAFTMGRAGLAQGAVLSLKGSSHDKGDAPPMALGTKVPVFRQRRKIGSIRNWIVGTHGLKARVYFGLGQGLLSATTKQFERRSLHYPRQATKTDFKQLTAEHLKRDDPRERGTWVHPQGVPNEQLDLAVYCLALAINEGLDRLDEAQWAQRAAARAPDLVEQQLTPLERLMRVADDGEAHAEPTPPPALPPAEGRGRGLSQADLDRIKAMGRKARGD